MEKKPLSFWIGPSQMTKLVAEKDEEVVTEKTSDAAVLFQFAYKTHREKIEDSNLPERFIIGKMIDDVFVLLHHGKVPPPSVLRHYTQILNNHSRGVRPHGNAI